MKSFLAKNVTPEIIKTFAGLTLIAISFGYLASIYIVSKEQNALLIKESLEKAKEISTLNKEKIDLSAQLDSERNSTKSLEHQETSFLTAVGEPKSPTQILQNLHTLAEL
jgi:hypothetical protein